MIGYIYKITNLENSKIYIGQTSRNYKTRWREHINYARKLKEGGQIKNSLQKDIKDLGKDKFKFEIVETINSESKQELSKKLDELEIYYIQKLNCEFPKGYNKTKGGSNSFSMKVCTYYNELNWMYPKLLDVTLTREGVTKYIYEWAAELNQDLLIFIENISSNWIKLRKYWNCSDLSKFPVFGEWDPQFYNVKEMEEYYDSDSVTKEQLKIKYWPRAPYKIGVNGYYYCNNEEVVNYIIKHNLQDYYPEILEKYNKKA